MRLQAVAQSKSSSFLALCVSFLFGVVIVSNMPRPQDLFPCILAAAVLALGIFLFWKDPVPRLIFASGLCMALGTVRFFMALPVENTGIAALAGQKRELEGYISKEPDIRTDGVRYIVAIANDGLHGSVYVKTNLYPRYAYGDALRLSCKIQKPEPMENFRYDMYLAARGVFAVCENARVQKIGEGGGNMAMRGILSVKQRVADRVNALWKEPHASLMAGLLYGYRGGLGEKSEEFNRTGMTHILAVSGQNVGLVAVLVSSVFVLAGISRKRAFFAVLLMLAAFVIFTGASGSVVRAGTMAAILLLAKQVGRLGNGVRALVLAAVIMVAENPLLLAWDAGFQLSAASTLGLALLSPILAPHLAWAPSVLLVRESLTQTLSAIIATLPLTLWQFGRASIVAPIVNVLVAGLVPILMIGGGMVTLVGFVFFPAGKLLSWAPYFGMEYILRVVKFFSDLQFAAVSARLPMFGMLFMYAALLYWVYTERTKTADMPE